MISNTKAVTTTLLTDGRPRCSLWSVDFYESGTALPWEEEFKGGGATALRHTHDCGRRRRGGLRERDFPSVHTPYSFRGDLTPRPLSRRLRPSLLLCQPASDPEASLVHRSGCPPPPLTTWPASTIKLIVSFWIQLHRHHRRSGEPMRGMARVYSDNPFGGNRD